MGIFLSCKAKWLVAFLFILILHGQFVGSTLALQENVLARSVSTAPSSDSEIQSSSLSSLSQSFSSSDPLEIFLYVRNNFIFEPYYGYMKGPLGTLNSGCGNDYDQASLLVYLLHRAYIQTRYVKGKITVSMDELRNWLRVETSEAAKSLLDYSRIPYQVQGKGTQSLVQINHIWVEANIKGSWVSMDPSFKQYAIHEPILASPLQANLWALPETEMYAPAVKQEPCGVTCIDTKQILRWVRYLDENSKLAMEHFKNARYLAEWSIRVADKYTMPPALVEEVFEKVPRGEQYYLQLTFPYFDSKTNSFTFVSNVSAYFPTYSFSEARATIYFVPVNEETARYVKSYAGGYSDERLDSRKVMMYPVLAFNGTLTVMGPGMPLGLSMPVIMRVLPAGRRWMPPPHAVLLQVGTWNSIVVHTGLHARLQDEILLGRIKRLNATVSALGKETVRTEDILGAILEMQGRLYFDIFFPLMQQIDDTFGLRHVRTVDVALIGYRYDWVRKEGKSSLSYSGPFMHLAPLRAVSRAVSVRNESESSLESRVIQRSALLGAMGGYLEGAVMRLLYNAAPVSCATILETANEQGVPIFVINSENWSEMYPRLSHPEPVLNLIKRNMIDQKLIAILPQRAIAGTALTMALSNREVHPLQITTLNFSAWIEVDPETGSVRMPIVPVSLPGLDAPAFYPLGGGSSGGAYLGEHVAEWVSEYLATHPTAGQPPTSGGLPIQLSGGFGDLPYNHVPSQVPLSISFPMLDGFAGQTTSTSPTVPERVVHGVTEQAVTEGGRAAIESSLGERVTFGSIIRGAVASILVQLGLHVLHHQGGRITHGNNNVIDQLMAPGPVQIQRSQSQPQVRSVWDSVRSGIFRGRASDDVASTPSTGDYSADLQIFLNRIYAMQYRTQTILRPVEQLAFRRWSGNQGRPTLAMYLVDREGRRTGCDPVSGSTFSESSYLLEYDGGIIDQTLTLWNPRAGNYTLMLFNNAEQEQQLALTGATYAGISSPQRKVMKVTIPSKSSVAASLSVWFDSKRELNVRFGEFSPAAFIILSNDQDRTIRGQLLDQRLTGLGDRQVDLFYRPSLEFSSAWKQIGSSKTSSDGHFFLDWKNAPTGSVEVMATYMDRFSAHETLRIPFPVKVEITNLNGELLADGDVRITTTDNRTIKSSIRGGSVSFEAYPGFNMMEITGTGAKFIAFIPFPVQQPIRLQANLLDLKVIVQTGDGSPLSQVPLNVAVNDKVIVVYSDERGVAMVRDLQQGTALTVSVTSPIPTRGLMGLLGSRTIFDHWSGGPQGSAESIKVIMDSPRNIIAAWRMDYGSTYAILGTGTLIAATVILGIILVTRKRKQV